MAILHNKAGQYCKTTAFDLHGRALTRVLLVASVGFVLVGVILGLSLASKLMPYLPAHREALALSVAAVLVGFTVWLLARQLHRFNPALDKLARERLFYLRGGQGEALVAWHLKELPDTWHLFNNVKLQENWDIDHILIGPGGFYCIQTKATRGMYSVTKDDVFLLNGKPTDHLSEVARQTMQLVERLRETHATVPWIQPVLAVPLAWVEFNSRQIKAWVLHADNLVTTLEKVGVHKLSERDVKRWSRVVEQLQRESERR